jgi:hypothetical protein
VIHMDLRKIIIRKCRGIRAKIRKQNIPCVKGKIVSELNYVPCCKDELGGTQFHVPHV